MLSILREKAVLTLLVLMVLGAGIGAGHDRALDRGSSFIVSDVVSLVLRPSASVFHIAVVAANIAERGRVRHAACCSRRTPICARKSSSFARRTPLSTEAQQENERLRAALGLSNRARSKRSPPRSSRATKARGSTRRPSTRAAGGCAQRLGGDHRGVAVGRPGCRD